MFFAFLQLILFFFNGFGSLNAPKAFKMILVSALKKVVL